MATDSLPGTLIATFRAIAEKGLAEEARALDRLFEQQEWGQHEASAAYQHIGRRAVWREVLAAVEGAERGCLIPSQVPAQPPSTGE